MNASIATTMLRAILRWWWLIVLSVSLGVGVGYIVRSQQPDLYFSEATVIVGADSNNPVPTGVDSTVLDAYSVLIGRNSLLQPVIDDLGLNISVLDLMELMSLETNRSASLITIGITDTDPERAAAIANRIVDELIRQTSDRATLLDLEFINSQIEDMQNQINNLQSQYNQLVQEAATITSAFELNQNIEDRGEIEKSIQELRTLLLSLIENAPRSEIQVFEPADPNYFPLTANSVRDLLIAGVAGGVLALLTIVLFTYFDDRLQWDEESSAETILGMRILGPLGIIPRNKLPLYVESMPQSIETEAMRQLRARIALAAGGDMPHILTVVSYDSGEGKTLTTANLALESAQTGLRTLIIDGDMRRGDMHEIFQLPNMYGLGDILQSNEPLANLLPNVLLDSGYENLNIIPAGRSEADPAALLGRTRLNNLIDLLSKRYDAIFIDAVPTIGGSDSVFLGEISDGVIIIVNARRTRLSSLRRSKDELMAAPNVNILGVVFNRVRLQVTSKYNNTYYRQTPALTPEKLSREMARSGSGLFGMRRHIITTGRGERLFSVSACAARLGVKRRTVQGWIETGHLQAESRFMRQWIPESAIDMVLSQRITTVEPPTPASGVSEESPDSSNGTHGTPGDLRAQREAILDFVSRPNKSDSEN